jgi:hypothetical protein
MAEHPDPVSRDREIPVVTTAATEIKLRIGHLAE